MGLTTRALVLELLLMIDIYVMGRSKTRTHNNKFQSPYIIFGECYFFNSQNFKVSETCMLHVMHKLIHCTREHSLYNKIFLKIKSESYQWFLSHDPCNKAQGTMNKG